MEKIIHRFKGSGIVWDSRRSKVFIDFKKNEYIFETDNQDDIAYMIKLGYEFDKVVIDIEDTKPSIEIKEKIEEKIAEIDQPIIDNKPEFDIPLPEPLSRETLYKLLDAKDIKYTKNMKTETLQKKLDEAK